MSYQILFQNAVKLYEDGDFDSAESIVREILLAMPEEIQAKKLLGFIAFEKELHEQAAEIFFEILISDSQNIEITLKLAQTLEGWGKYSEAIDYYDKALLSNQNDLSALYGKGVCLQSLGQIEKAKLLYEQAIAMDPQNWQALLGLASIEEGNKEKSLEYIQKAYDASPDNPFILYQFADFYKRDKKYEDAIRYIEHASEIYPHPRMQDLMAQLYYKTNQVDKAERILTEIIKKDPSYVPAYSSLALILIDKTDFKTAKKTLQTSLEYDRNYIDAYVNLGAIAHKQGLLLEAIENYRKALDINPQTPEALLNLGLILHEQGDLDEALGMYFNVLSIDPETPNIDNALFESISDYIQTDKENAKKLAELWQKASPASELAKVISKQLSDV